ncbi:MAG: class I SAM-dependent methyltransferase [Deltaproteobacteria bacterium]|nr:class I SAM-dependent methyltransferase [Deltaproteobacteria bacterium]
MRNPYDEGYFRRLNRLNRIGNNPYRESQRLDVIEHLCRPMHEDRILELGCGTGVYTRLLAGHARGIVGVDFSEAAIIRARSENSAENIQYVLTDIQNLSPFLRDTFQKVVAVDVLEHLTDVQLVNVLREVNRVLSRQGLFILFTPCRTHWIERLKSRNFLLKQTPGHIGVRTEQEIRDSMQRSGLQVNEIIRYETCIPVLRLLERHLKKLPSIGNHFVSRLGMSASKAGREPDE